MNSARVSTWNQTGVPYIEDTYGVYCKVTLLFFVFSFSIEYVKLEFFEYIHMYSDKKSQPREQYFCSSMVRKRKKLPKLLEMAIEVEC